IFPVGVVVREQWNDVVAHQGLVGRKDVVRQSGTMSWNQTPPGAQNQPPSGGFSCILARLT
ncbi:hypothetical protein, partial [Corynebacterium tuberculostearicum]|uniref:hypothetical protein n=1 Tax=Corynebacterium tuberculostearicum TaxID=38304 RepID=UPI002934CB0A